MAAKKPNGSAPAGGKSLVIVESPAKARTIGKFLGRDYIVEASIGHIRDLPANAADIPAKYKGESWARLGIDIDEGFKPLYVVPKEKRDHIKKLKALVKNASHLLLATDEDREGESISWHLVQELAPGREREVRRLVFHEITKSAIEHALANTRLIDIDLVEAQETRRLVDRLFGYTVSPLLWKKVRPRLSAGRVQSVAVRLVVERERERMRFKTAEYWDLAGTFAKREAAEDDAGAGIDARLVEAAGHKVATGRDFDPDTGKLTDNAKDRIHLDEPAANALVDALRKGKATVVSLEQKPFTERPYPPFTTSTLQQEAGRKLGFTAKRAMRAAQRLYENGYITYMRTDSTTLSGEAIGAARRLIERSYGAQYLPEAPRTYATKVKNAQEAHEAIRPAGSEFRDPQAVRGGDLGLDETRLYELIWKRTVACQMKDAKGKRTTLVLSVTPDAMPKEVIARLPEGAKPGDDAKFQATGRVIEFPGFRLAYVEQREDAEAAVADQDKILPAVDEGEELRTRAIVAEHHATKPPARLTEASLVKEMEARGIGRPSTYASIIETIQSRDYCFKKGSALVPTFTAFAVVDLLDRFLPQLVDYAFTAKMEDDLDEISNGRQNRTEYLRHFYHGNGNPGLRDRIVSVEEKIDPRDVCTLADFKLGEGPTGEPIELRVGRYGPFLSSGEVSATLPDELPPDELTAEMAQDLLAKAKEGPKALGTDPATGLKIYCRVGRFGPYVQRGDADQLGDEKPKMASLLPDMDPETITLEQALQLVNLPRRLGRLQPVKPDGSLGEEDEVLAFNGRFGPYLKCGSETRSLGADDHLLRVGFERARELFSQPKQRGRGASSAKVLKELGEHPESKKPVRVLDGRYGPYVSDGTTNATLPRDVDPEKLEMTRAVDLLAEKAARGPSKKTTRKKASKKTATKKTTAKKTTAKKTGSKATKKKTSKKSSSKKSD
jgi:DNA topoisomerase-1